MRLRFEPSEIERFNLRMARLQVTDDDAGATAAAIVDLARSENVEMLTLRVPTERLGLIQEAEGLGFRLMDCLVYYEAPAQGLSGDPRPSLRAATPADADDVARVARACFFDYPSHYHADARLDRRLVAEGYADWARRSCLDAAVASAVLVAEAGGEIAGFATLRRNGTEEGEGVLFAVHPGHAGAGTFGALVDAAKRWCAEGGMTRMLYSTQLDNRRVQRSLANRGFRLARSFFTLHRWFI